MSEFKKAVVDLQRAGNDVSKYHPLPRCSHGHTLCDHADTPLCPSCGCRLTSQEVLIAADELAEAVEELDDCNPRDAVTWCWLFDVVKATAAAYRKARGKKS